MPRSRQSTDSEAPKQRSERDLEALRTAIDAVDQDLLEALNRRARLVQEVGAWKTQGDAPVYVAGRERDLVANLIEANSGPFPNAGIPHVFREVISATRSLEQVVRVAFLGPLGTFSHEAALRQFGGLVELVPVHTISEVFEATERGRADFGIVPIENAAEGAVAASLDALVESDLPICAEVVLEIRQNLMSRAKNRNDITSVVSHPQPLGQCASWLTRNLPGIPQVESASTAAAAVKASEDASVAAIGSEVAAEVYGLRILEAGIEDARRNRTRFVVIGREAPTASGDDRTAAVFTIHRDQAGALHQLLEPFSRHGVNLSSIQSRPIKGKAWEYLFFVDVEGHVDQAEVAAALADAGKIAHSGKVLGSFPRARIEEGGVS
jgi:chorismate mutase/prephenate dehydratase